MYQRQRSICVPWTIAAETVAEAVVQSAGVQRRGRPILNRLESPVLPVPEMPSVSLIDQLCTASTTLTPTTTSLRCMAHSFTRIVQYKKYPYSRINLKWSASDSTHTILYILRPTRNVLGCQRRSGTLWSKPRSMGQCRTAACRALSARTQWARTCASSSSALCRVRRSPNASVCVSDQLKYFLFLLVNLSFKVDEILLPLLYRF